ncbi:hypothetical protein PL321_02740 [Caloramator sp. mosi_1]|uniref:hypothetical protein n=1 Tax=Caloramator sp. mosi_1 TaxID=3023090 RepID=UPI0023608974|nr:hypothetical protein [Caloramator sp. mosi_1]WDC84640.1 hypothetical protein PL321_02740 [Caloramator sp. mosi_1]
MDTLNLYLKDLEKRIIPENSFKIGKIELYSYEDIQELFLKNYYDLPFLKRLNEIKNICKIKQN